MTKKYRKYVSRPMIKGVTPCQSLMPSALPGSHAAIVSVIKAGTKAVVGPTPDEVRVTCDANDDLVRRKHSPQVPTAIRVMVTVTFSCEMAKIKS